MRREMQRKKEFTSFDVAAVIRELKDVIAILVLATYTS
jgi:hypothetical protein